jgi:hypothetical protein
VITPRQCTLCQKFSPPRQQFCECGYYFGPAEVEVPPEPVTVRHVEAVPVPAIEVKTFRYRRTWGTYYVDRFASTRTMDDHISQMLQQGWTLFNATTFPGQARVGDTLAANRTDRLLGLVAGGRKGSGQNHPDLPAFVGAIVYAISHPRAPASQPVLHQLWPAG